MMCWKVRMGELTLQLYLPGLTELAQRFPEDFSSLMDAFEEEQEEKEIHRPSVRNIQPSEIRMLANIISEEEVTETRKEVKEVKKAKKVNKGSKVVRKDVICKKPASPSNGQVENWCKLTILLAAGGV